MIGSVVNFETLILNIIIVNISDCLKATMCYQLFDPVICKVKAILYIQWEAKGNLDVL